jgi:hypothetical protein
MRQSVDFDTLVKAMQDGHTTGMRTSEINQLGFTTACWLRKRGVTITMDGKPFEPGNLSLVQADKLMRERGLID